MPKHTTWVKDLGEVTFDTPPAGGRTGGQLYSPPMTVTESNPWTVIPVPASLGGTTVKDKAE